MTQNFFPAAGNLFYATFRTLRRDDDATADGVLVRVVSEKDDKNLHEKVFSCVAADTHAVVADVAFGYNWGRRVLTRHAYKFHPVGPEVAMALGLVKPDSSPVLPQQSSAAS